MFHDRNRRTFWYALAIFRTPWQSRLWSVSWWRPPASSWTHSEGQGPARPAHSWAWGRGKRVGSQLDVESGGGEPAGCQVRVRNQLVVRSRGGELNKCEVTGWGASWLWGHGMGSQLDVLFGKKLLHILGCPSGGCALELWRNCVYSRYQRRGFEWKSSQVAYS